MKHVPLLVLATALLALSPASRAGEGEKEVEVKKEFKIVVAGDAGLGSAEAIHLDLEGDDLEIGESRQFFTDSGKEILVTRTEDGLDVEVDGEDLDLDTTHERVVVRTEIDGDVDEERHVVIRTHGRTHGDGESHGEHRFHFVGEGGREIEIDGDRVHWSTVGEDGEPHVFFVKTAGKSAAEHLEESGALDGLDPAEKERVLEALREYDATAVPAPRPILEIHREHEEHEHEEHR